MPVIKERIVSGNIVTTMSIGWHAAGVAAAAGRPLSRMESRVGAANPLATH